MKTLIAIFVLISSAVLPNLGIAAEDFVFEGNLLHIRTLAASCAACHGTLGNAVRTGAEQDATVLAGLEKDHIVQRLMDFKSGARKSTVMHRHASGLALEEIYQLADYFSNQTPVQQAVLKSQTLKEIGNEQ